MSSTTIGVVIYTLLILALGVYLGIITTDYCNNNNNNNKEDKK